MAGKNKVILIDTNNLAYRAFYALPMTIATSTGQVTNAVFGFTSMLLKIMEEHRPDMIICAFDSRGPTFRHEMFEKYKATRKKMPDELACQLPLIKEIAQSLNILSLEKESYEADDIIATLVEKLKNKFEKIIIVSGDKDILQLVSENISVIAVKKGITDIFTYHKDEVVNKFGVLPKQIKELLALTGDASDNIPGAAGIGPKTALDLITQFKNVEEIYRNTDKIKSEKLKDLLISQEQSVRTSLELAVLHNDLDLELEDIDTYGFSNLNHKKVEDIFSILEFSTLKKRLDIIMGFYRGSNAKKLQVKDVMNSADTEKKKRPPGEPEAESKNKKMLSLSLHLNEPDLETLLDPPQKSVYISLITPESSSTAAGGFSDKTLQKSDSDAVIIISGNLKDYYIFNHRLLSDRNKRKALEEILKNQQITKSGYDFKQVFKFLENYGLELKGRINDYKIQYLLLNPVKPETSIKDVFLDTLKIAISENEMNGLQPVFQLLPHEKTIKYPPVGSSSGPSVSKQMELGFGAEKDNKDNNKENEKEDNKESEINSIADVTGQEVKSAIEVMLHFPQLDKVLSGKISEEGLEKLYYDIESPLIEVLANMEFKGVSIDLAYLNDLIRQYDIDIKELTNAIYGLCNANFNINSTQQLSKVLFEELKLSPAKKTKTGYSTDAGTLISIYTSHPVIEKILDYREKVKLKNTYLDVLPNLIDSRDGRVHTTYNQLGTTTGRISSNNPNLQNIPVRTELGRQIRKAFTPGKGYDLLLSADYSQIELRILAHLSGDDDLIEAFKTGFDIHTKTASEIFNVDYEKVDEDLRRKAKAINFGIIYGMTEFGLKNRLSISEDEAKQYIKLYFARYPKVRSYINDLISTVYKTGYTQTMFGRKRYIKELSSTNANLRNLGERLAVNTPIQGSAADIMKLATVVLFNALKKISADCNLILHVHDEIVLELKEKDLEVINKTVTDSMENCIILKTGMKVDIKTGKSWFI